MKQNDTKLIQDAAKRIQINAACSKTAPQLMQNAAKRTQINGERKKMQNVHSLENELIP